MSVKANHREFWPESTASAPIAKQSESNQAATLAEAPTTDMQQPKPGTPAHTLNLQQTVGNQAVVRRLSAGRAQNTIQRAFTAPLPIAYVGNDATTAHGLLTKYIRTAAVATGGRKFTEEYQRILDALGKIQPTKAKELEDRRKSVGMDLKDESKAIANAALLEGFVTYVNGLVATYQLDAAPGAITARVDDNGSHHMDYFFKMPGELAEKKFDLDDWSRKGKDFLNGQSGGATIKAIVNEIITDWDTDRGSIVTLLVSRLLGGSGELGGSAEGQNINALFMNSPIGANYTKILIAADHIIGVRTKDLKPRGVKVEHWKKTTPTVKENDQDGSVNWPALLKTARAAFKTEMGKASVADQPTARKMAVDAIKGDATLIRLKGLGVLDMDETDGTFALNNRPQKKGNDVHQVLADERFGFDINHFTAILFFEWKAITDLKT